MGMAKHKVLKRNYSMEVDTFNNTATVLGKCSATHQYLSMGSMTKINLQRRFTKQHDDVLAAIDESQISFLVFFFLLK